MNKFENVDVLAALEQLMRQNTAFYRNDFEIDKEAIRQAAASDRAEDKTLLWMSRPSLRILGLTRNRLLLPPCPSRSIPVSVSSGRTKCCASGH